MKSIKLKGKQQAFLIALLETKTTEQAIKQANINRHTAYGYLKEPEFNKALRKARSEAVQIVSQRLSLIGEKAVNALDEIIADPDTPATSKVTAIRTVLEYLYKTYENDELEERIEQLENHIKGENN